jgi:Na+/proline symporter
VGWGSFFFVVVGSIFAFLGNNNPQRDANISGWFQLLWFIPVIGWILMLVMLSLPAVEFNRFNKTERKKEAKEHKDIKIKTNVTPSARETAVYVKTNTNKSKKTGKE